MRSCGECTACCTLCHVPELGKVEGAACPHCDAGCTVYAVRPATCRSYACAWVQGQLPEHMRPDQCGVMVELYPRMVAALLVPGWQLMELQPATLEVLDTFVAAGLPVISSGQFARLPAGLSGQEAKRILIETIVEYRNGGVLQH